MLACIVRFCNRRLQFAICLSSKGIDSILNFSNSLSKWINISFIYILQLGYFSSFEKRRDKEISHLYRSFRPIVTRIFDYIFINPITFAKTIRYINVYHSFPNQNNYNLPKTNRFVAEIFIKIPNNIPRNYIFISAVRAQDAGADTPGSLIPRL